MTAKRKPQMHTTPCSQAENVEKLNALMVGNHEPENGVVYKVMKAAEDINEIKDHLKGLKENHNVLLGEITRVGADVANIKGVQAGREGKDTKDNNTWIKWLTIVGVVSAISLGIWSNLKTDAKTADSQKEILQQNNQDYHNLILSIDSLKKKYSLLEENR
jgi:hypothetical protein